MYLDDESVRRLDELARKEKVARNALIRRAVLSLLDGSSRAWPDVIMQLTGDPAITPFESHRGELAPLVDDPLAVAGAKATPRRRRRVAETEKRPTRNKRR